MSSGGLLALALFASGLVSLLAWVALMLGNPRLAPILHKAVIFFLLPGALMVALPAVVPLGLLLPVALRNVAGIIVILLLLVLVEECLKMFAARSERRPSDKFALAMLFGIGELMLAKPIGPLLAGEMFGAWSRWGLIGITIGGILAMLMHSVTAAIYAYCYPSRPGFALILCFLLHAFYNFMMLAFQSVTTVVVAAIIFGIMLIVLVPGRQDQGDVAADP